MNAMLLTPAETPVDQLLLDENVQQEAREVIADAHDRSAVGIAIELEDGSTITLPKELSQALLFAIHGMTQGNVAMRAMPDELTTSTAAGILGVSRPTLMKLITDGTLPATKRGSHHRLTAKDVLALRDKRAAARKAAFDELRRVDADLDLG